MEGGGGGIGQPYSTKNVIKSAYTGDFMKKAPKLPVCTRDR